MTDAELRAALEAELKATTFGYRVRPHSPRWNRVMALVAQIDAVPPSHLTPEYRVKMPKATAFNAYFLSHDSPATQVVGDGIEGNKRRVIRWGPGGLYAAGTTWVCARFKLVKGNPGRMLDWHTQPNDVGGWTPPCSGGVAPIAVDYFDTRGLEIAVEPENDGCSGGSGNYHFQLLSQAAVEAMRGQVITLDMEIIWGRRDEGRPGSIRAWLNNEAAPRVNVAGINTHWPGEQQVTFWEGTYWSNGNPQDIELELTATRFGRTLAEARVDAPFLYTAGGTGVANGSHEVIG